MLVATLVLAALAPLQEPSREDLVARRDKKLQSPFLKAAPWRLDYEAALKEAADRKVPVFAYFTRSYAD